MQFLTRVGARLRPHRWRLVALAAIGFFVEYLIIKARTQPWPRGTIGYSLVMSVVALSAVAIFLAGLSFAFGPGGELVLDKNEGWLGRSLTTVLGWFWGLLLLGGMVGAVGFVADAWLALLAPGHSPDVLPSGSSSLTAEPIVGCRHTCATVFQAARYLLLLIIVALLVRLRLKHRADRKRDPAFYRLLDEAEAADNLRHTDPEAAERLLDEAEARYEAAEDARLANLRARANTHLDAATALRRELRDSIRYLRAVRRDHGKAGAADPHAIARLNRIDSELLAHQTEVDVLTARIRALKSHS